jgi:hypothetical protein
MVFSPMFDKCSHFLKDEKFSPLEGTNKFDWEGKCNSFTKFLVFTTKNTKQANYFPGDTNPWLWSKLELSCSQSTTLKAQLDEIVELKISGKNSDYKKTYPRSWQSPAKPAYSVRLVDRLRRQTSNRSDESLVKIANRLNSRATPTLI